MNLRHLATYLGLFLLACQPVQAQDNARANPADNHGRQIASALPRAAVARHQSSKLPQQWQQVLPGVDWKGQPSEHKLHLRLSLSPSMETALEYTHSLAAGLFPQAQLYCHQAISWLVDSWRELNSFPRVSPGNPEAFRHLVNPQQAAIYWTTERRLKTVVDR